VTAFLIRAAVLGDMPALRDVFRRSSLSDDGDRGALLAHPDALELSDLAVREERTRVAVADDRIVRFASGFGNLARVGVEGTGSYVAGLARHLAAAGIGVVEVDRADRQDRHRRGKSDPLDAISAARAAQSGRAAGAPRGRDGAVEAIRALMVAKRSARTERTPGHQPGPGATGDRAG
jgi:hypothetical protein